MVEPDPLPPQFEKARSVLVSLAPKKTERWVPDLIELMVWPYESAREKVPWPKDWPTIGDARTKKYRDSLSGDLGYSLYLSGSELSEVEAYVKSLRGAVLLDGKKWSLNYRYTFPQEQVWNEAWAEAKSPDR